MLGVYSILGFLAAVAFSMAFIPVVLRLATFYGFYDLPDKPGAGVSLAGSTLEPARKVHGRPIPRLGGVAIFLGFFLTQILLLRSPALTVPLGISLVIFSMGLLDDLYNLPAWLKLAVQTICAGAVVYMCGLGLPYFGITTAWQIALPPAVGFAFSVFIIVGAMNAINMIDGLDGLAGGVVLIGIGLMSFVYFLRTQDPDLLVYLSLPMMGAIIGFLRFNTHPAEIFMGDSGSNWLGFMVGFLFLILVGNWSLATGSANHLFVQTATARGSAVVPIICAVMCLAMPVFDTACVMLSRMLQGHSPLRADQRHFHHSLLQLGLSHSQSVVAVYFIALVAGLIGVLPIIFDHLHLDWLPYVSAVALVLFIPLSVSIGHATGMTQLIDKRMRLRAEKRIGPAISSSMNYWDGVNLYLLFFIFLGFPAFAGPIPENVGLAALAAASFMVISWFFRGTRQDFLDSLAIALGGIVILIANNKNEIQIGLMNTVMPIQKLYNAVFIFVFVSTLLLSLVTLKRRYLEVSASDFLLLTLPLMLLLAPTKLRDEYRLDTICLRSLVLFMVIRFAARRRPRTMFQLKIALLTGLCFIFLSGYLRLRIVY